MVILVIRYAGSINFLTGTQDIKPQSGISSFWFVFVHHRFSYLLIGSCLLLFSWYISPFPYMLLLPTFIQWNSGKRFSFDVNAPCLSLQAFVISFTSEFIPRMIYQYMYSANGTMNGYTEHSLSYFNVSDFPPGTAPTTTLITGVTMCRSEWQS